LQSPFEFLAFPSAHWLLHSPVFRLPILFYFILLWNKIDRKSNKGEKKIKPSELVEVTRSKLEGQEVHWFWFGPKQFKQLESQAKHDGHFGSGFWQIDEDEVKVKNELSKGQ